MGGCDPITYHNVTQNVFESLKNRLIKAGIKIPAGKRVKLKDMELKVISNGMELQI